MNPNDVERLIKSGLEAPVTNDQVNMVPIQGPDGSTMNVPADVGTFFAINTLVQQIQQMNFRLDALHAHAKAGSHPKSQGQRNCPICTAQNLTPEQVEELKQKVAEQRQEQEEEMAAIINRTKEAEAESAS